MKKQKKVWTTEPLTHLVKLTYLAINLSYHPSMSIFDFDGSEIRCSPVEVGSLSTIIYAGFYHHSNDGKPWDFCTINCIPGFLQLETPVAYWSSAVESSCDVWPFKLTQRFWWEWVVSWGLWKKRPMTRIIWKTCFRVVFIVYIIYINC